MHRSPVGFSVQYKVCLRAMMRGPVLPMLRLRYVVFFLRSSIATGNVKFALAQPRGATGTLGMILSLSSIFAARYSQNGRTFVQL